MCRHLNHLANWRSLAVILALAVPVTVRAEQTVLVVQSHDRVIHYDLAGLEALGAVDVTTTTIWTRGPQHFTGVPLEDVLADAGIEEGTIVVTAINDYAAMIPVDEAGRDEDGLGPIIAYHLDGKPMPVRDKGPLWLVYPYAAKSGFRTELVYSRSVWQLDRIRQIQ